VTFSDGQTFYAKGDETRPEIIATVDSVASVLSLTTETSLNFLKIMRQLIVYIAGHGGGGGIIVQGSPGPAGNDGANGTNGVSRIVAPFLPGTTTFTNMPLADTELPAANYRVLLDLTGCTEYRASLRVATVGSVNADVRFQGSLDDSVFGNLDGSTGPEIGSLNSLGQKTTGWVTLAAQYRADNVRIRMMGKDGDGALDPVLRQITLQFR